MNNIKLPVPLVCQSDYCACGAACLCAIHYYWRGGSKKYYFEKNFSDLLGRKPLKGITVSALLKATKRLKFKAFYKTNLTINDLDEFLRLGFTQILFMQGGGKNSIYKSEWKKGHAAVLVGLNSKYVYLMDPGFRQHYVRISIKTFLDRWHAYDGSSNAEHGAIIIADNNKIPVVRNLPQTVIDFY
jgi:ABC-type bacteriocin/lantibiotic exporter with double-glycine peptidase domain